MVIKFMLMDFMPLCNCESGVPQKTTASHVTDILLGMMMGMILAPTLIMCTSYGIVMIQDLCSCPRATNLEERNKDDNQVCTQLSMYGCGFA